MLKDIQFTDNLSPIEMDQLLFYKYSNHPSLFSRFYFEIHGCPDSTNLLIELASTSISTAGNTPMITDTNLEISNGDVVVDTFQLV